MVGLKAVKHAPTNATAKSLAALKQTEHQNNVVIGEPIPIGHLLGLLTEISNLHISNSQNPGQNKGYLVAVVGEGLTAEHVVTHYIPDNYRLSASTEEKANQTIHAFSSKYISLDNFYKPDTPLRTSRLRRISGAVKAFVYSLLPFRINETFKDANVNIQITTLGHQSLLDEATSRQHSDGYMQYIQALMKGSASYWFLPRGLSPNSNAGFEGDFRANNPIRFKDFIQTAWLNTFLGGYPDAKQKEQSFKHYFLGWPLPENVSTARKVFYFLSLSFLTTPLLSLFKLAIQFPINLLSETANYLRNKLITTAPSNFLMQYLRTISILLTGGLQFLSKATALLVNAVFSPIDSFKQAWNRHPLLGIFSALVSITAVAAVAVFLTPLLINVLSSVIPNLVSALIPVAEAFLVINIPAIGIIASASAVLAGTVLGLKALKEILIDLLKFFSPRSGQASATHKTQGGNPADIFNATTLPILPPGPASTVEHQGAAMKQPAPDDDVEPIEAWAAAAAAQKASDDADRRVQQVGHAASFNGKPVAPEFTAMSAPKADQSGGERLPFLYFAEAAAVPPETPALEEAVTQDNAGGAPLCE